MTDLFAPEYFDDLKKNVEALCVKACERSIKESLERCDQLVMDCKLKIAGVGDVQS